MMMLRRRRSINRLMMMLRRRRRSINRLMMMLRRRITKEEDDKEEKTDKDYDGKLYEVHNNEDQE